MQPEFFVDRSLGRHQVADALRTRGWRISTHHEVYSERDEAIPDVEWLEYCADRGLVVLSKDRRLRYRPDEIAVIQGRGLRVFVLARGNLAAAVQGRRFIDNEALIRAELGRSGPFVCAVYAHGVKRIFR